MKNRIWDAPGIAGRRWQGHYAILAVKTGLILTIIGFFIPLAQGQNGYVDIRIPKNAGFVFPTSESALVAMRDEQKTSEMRKHAWAIFAGITQPATPKDAPAIWETWFTRSQTLSNNGCLQKHDIADIHRELELPLELIAAFATKPTKQDQTPLAEAVAFFSNPGTSIVSNVLFNADACKHIQDNQLYDRNTMRGLLATFDSLSTPPTEREIKPFPQTAIVVKAFWKLVDRTGSELEVWDAPAIGRSRKVKVSPAHGRQCNLPLVSNEPILTSCFYNVSVTPYNLHDIKKVRPADVGDVMVLVGLHVITKEISDWTWSTFWWNSNADFGPYASERPISPIVNGFWRFYLMDTTLSMDTPFEGKPTRGDTPGENDPCQQLISDSASRAKIIANPYLEHIGSMTNAEISNCMNCHKRATFEPLEPEMLGSPRRGYLSSESTCFSHAVRLDYLWSLSTKDAVRINLFIRQLKSALNLE